MTTTPLPVNRPTRADARRNYDLLVTAAREAFIEHGAETSLEEIARRAGVGIGTLYRRFPNRTALLEAVFVDEIQAVCDHAYALADKLDPYEALAGWLRGMVRYNVARKSLAAELTVALGKDSKFFQACKVNLREAGDLLLDRAKAAGAVRQELELMDILRLVGGITMGPEIDPDHAERLLGIILAGLRPLPTS